MRISYILFSQWLVKRSVETREEMWHFVRSFAVGQFNKLCPLLEEQRTLVQQDNMLRNIRAIKVMFSFLISNFRHVLYVVCFLLCNSPTSEFYMPTFRNTLPAPSS
jgi:hypothetical protein